jgi:hypothetical protein
MTVRGMASPFGYSPTSDNLFRFPARPGVLYTMHKRPDLNGRCRKMSWMRQFRTSPG